MKQIVCLLFTISLSAILISCGEYQCSKADLRFGLIGFSDAEADTIVLRRFDKTGNFNSPLDTFLLTNISFNRRSDTLVMGAFPGTALLQSDHNYQIFFPQGNTLISVTEIAEEQRSIRRSFTDKVGCVNFIQSCKLNGQLTPINSNDLYLRK
jgi:hypothetical protein